MSALEPDMMEQAYFPILQRQRQEESISLKQMRNTLQIIGYPGL